MKKEFLASFVIVALWMVPAVAQIPAAGDVGKAVGTVKSAEAKAEAVVNEAEAGVKKVLGTESKDKAAQGQAAAVKADAKAGGEPQKAAVADKKAEKAAAAEAKKAAAAEKKAKAKAAADARKAAAAEKAAKAKADLDAKKAAAAEAKKAAPRK
jgi:colicin import membrane protein